MSPKRYVREETIHRAVIAYLRAVLPAALVFHVPNEGKRSDVGHGIAVGLGLMPGWPDIGLIMPGGQSYWFEVKAAQGVLSKRQARVHERMAAAQIPVAVVRSIDETRAALTFWQLQTREAA